MKKYKKSLVALAMLLLYIVTLMVFYVGLRFGYTNILFFRNGYYLILTIYISIFMLFNIIFGGFKIGILRLNELIYSNCLSILLSNILSYLQLSLIENGLLDFKVIIIMSVIQSIVLLIGLYLINRFYFILNPARQVLVICSNDNSEYDLIYKMSLRKEKYHISQIVKEDINNIELFKYIDSHNCILIGNIDSELKQTIIAYSYRNNIRLYLMPTITDLVISKSSSTQIFDTPVFICNNDGLSVEQQLIKTAIDKLISMIALIVVSPIMLITGLLIKIQDGGPVFYKQIRVTKDNQEFNVLKFRSMIMDAESDGKARLATKNDCRITKLGKFIRATRIDELPQLINILRGDMSIVGPRPERPEIIDKYVKELPDFVYRTKVKAGLTGLAQVLGKYNTTPKDKLMFDLLYIEDYSLWLDFKIMLMTVKILFMKSSTEGIDSGKVDASIKDIKKDMDNE